MLKKSFSLASAVSLMGAVCWVTSTAACGGSDETNGSSTSSGGGSSGDAGASSSSGGTSGTASSSGTTTSSSGSSGNDGGLVNPKTVPGVEVKYGKCDDFTKCDGSIVGSWTVKSGCLADSTFDEYKKACAGLKEHDVIIKASGTVDATATEVTRKTSIFLSAQMDVPKFCAAIAGGCGGLGGILQQGFGGSAFDHATCTDGGDVCKCSADVTVKEAGTPSKYTTHDKGGLTTENPTQEYEYCPSGGSITYREVTKDNKTFGMFLTIGK